MLGARGQGWQVSRTTLRHERNSIGSSAQTTALFEALVRLARSTSRGGRPALEDPEIRQRLAALEGYVRAHQCSGWRQLTRDAHGRDGGILPLLNKLVSTNIGHEVARIALDLLGDEGLLAPAEREAGVVPRGGAAWLAQVMGSLGSAIAGGTANIQRNLIAERGLGLPRDAAAERGSGR
jgi:alkylation response protein AidB-like acyl-CoA dehydrogenase